MHLRFPRPIWTTCLQQECGLACLPLRKASNAGCSSGVHGLLIIAPVMVLVTVMLEMARVVQLCDL
jgi:hypothetical protein